MPEENKLGLTQQDVENRERTGGIAGLFRAMGNAQADADAIAASEDGRLIEEQMSLMAMPENSSENKAFWAGYEKGLRKTIYGEGLNKWAFYLPLAADTEQTRKFPLIFCLHGAHNPIQLTETYGIIQLAARKECMVIATENENLDNLLSLLSYAESHFPVDRERIYLMGYSFGGCMSARSALARPDIFAGAGMGGMLFAGDMPESELDGQHYDSYQLTEEMLQKAEACRMPALIYVGENEMLNLVPLGTDQPNKAPDGVIPLDSRDKQRYFNNWRRVSGCAPVPFLKPEETENEVEKMIGAQFERTEIREYNGRKYYIGDSVTPEGKSLFRMVAVEKMVHWPTAVFASLIWEQIGHYRRNRETGELFRID